MRSTLMAAAGFVLACSAVLAARPFEALPASPAVSFWESFYQGAVEATHYSSLDEMKDDSRVVLVGTIEVLELSRQWVAIEEWGDDGVATYVLARIKPEELLRGTPSFLRDGTVGLELFLANPAALDGVLASLPPERAVYFLTPKEDVAGLYRLSSSQGYLRDRGHVEAPVGNEDEWLKALQELTFEELVAQLRR